MGPGTGCPHPSQLRLYSRGQAQSRETEAVRAHVEACEACRGRLAGFTDEAEPQITMAFRDDRATRHREESVENGGVKNTIVIAETVPPGLAGRPNGEETIEPTFVSERVATRPHAISPADGGESGRSEAVTATDATVEIPRIRPVEQSEGDGAFELRESTTNPERLPQVDPMATGEFRLDSAADPDSLSFVDSGVSPTVNDGTNRTDPVHSRLGGVTVRGYDILEELGRGGMGVVYKARHRRLQRLVALKMVLAGAHVGPMGLARFRSEAEAVAKLSHPNIVQIYETGEHDGLPFFSLELVEGGNLDQKMRESPTSPRAAAQIIETLARAMTVAHDLGIVHRDLKPANILLSRGSGQSSMVRRRDLDPHASLPTDHWSRTTVPKIADFGLAKQVDDDSSQTRSGTILGTPSYMAPEQAEGKNREIGPAADIYSLGAILYELLVGRPPFRAGNPIDTIRQVLEQEPVPPRQLEPRVPHDLETICLKCLEKDPSRRYAGAIALAEDLRRFIEGDPIQARPTPFWERAWKWGRRRKAVVALLAVSTLAVVSMIVLIAWHNVSLQGKLDVALAQERRSRQRELDAVEDRRLTLVRQEGQKLLDGARLAVAVRDWSTARLNLEKALTTIGDERRLDSVKEPAAALLGQVERELRVESDRRASDGRLRSFSELRDEAQFLGTLYTGMDLAANLEAARSAVRKALAVYGVLETGDVRPRFDAYLSDARKAEVEGDCSQLLLTLAETEAQSISASGAEEKRQHLQKALDHLEHARRLGAPVRAYHLRRARYLGALGDAATAAREEKAAQDAPLIDVADHFLMADELYRRERFDEANKAFERVLERKPGHFWAQYLDALCLLRQQRPAEARALLGACLAQRADFVWLYLLRGFAQEELQAWAAADADFQKAARMPLDDNARYVMLVHRGVLRMRTDRTDAAIADLQAAIELKPKAYQAYVNLAQAYRRLDRRGPALDQLRRAVELEPGLAHLYRLQAQLHLERDELDGALTAYDRAIEREDATSPYLVDDQFERGRLLLRVGKAEAALASFDAALALRRDHGPAQRLRAEALFRLGRFEEVVAAFDRYLETGKPIELVYRGRGLARAELGQYPGAIEDFTKALELHPTSAVQAYRGWAYLVVDAPKLAMRDFELAIDLDSSNGDAYSGRGFARAKLGLHREALRDAAEALRHGPPSPRLFFNAARIYAQCPGPYANRATDLIEQAVGLLPAGDRRAFWLTHVQKDAALAGLRRHPTFIRLETQLSARP